MFRGMMQDLEIFGQDVNMKYLEEEFAIAWNKDPAKLFNGGQTQGQQQGMPGQQPAGQSMVDLPFRSPNPTKRSPECTGPTCIQIWMRYALSVPQCGTASTGYKQTVLGSL
jgi:hypothetical protein